MEKIIVAIKDLSCISGNRYLLHQINWTIRQGEHWLLFGSNGCGKTTLLSVLAGFKAYDAGTLEVFGQGYSEDNIIRQRRRIGWVSSSFFDKYYHQERALDIVLSGLSGGLGKSFQISNAQLLKAQTLLAELNLADKMERPFDLLSKGERQNVLIARALVTEPELLILDEPGTGLDVFARARMLERVERLAQDERITIIYVTHYTDELLDCFDQTVLLRNGRIYAQGPTEALFTEEVLTPFLGQRAKVTFAPGAITVKLETTSQVCRILEGGECDGS